MTAILDSHPVPSPLYISGRLMAALDIDGAGTLHLSALGTDAEGRQTYEYVIADQTGRALITRDDLRSGVGGQVDYLAMMGTLLAFLNHTAEQYASTMGSEPADGWSFNAEVAGWAYCNDDALQSAAMDVDPEMLGL